MKRSVNWWLVFSAAILASTSGAAESQASIITWGTAQQVTGDSDVLNAGTTDRAYLFAADPGPWHTINGVTFKQFNTYGGTDSLTFTNSFTGHFMSGNPPFASLSPSYQALLGSGVFSFDSTATLTLTGLSIGTAYEVQLWVNDSRANTNVARQTVSGSPILTVNTSGLDGGLGQFVIGSFVADSTQQVFTFTPENPDNPAIYLNGLQLRVANVPEPSSMALLGIAGGIGLIWTRLRRQPVKT